MQIRVELVTGDQYRVVIVDGDDHSEHVVTVTPEHRREFGAFDVSPERLIEEAFRFLLEREPKEEILARFELPVIGRYFPEFPAELRRRMAQP